MIRTSKSRLTRSHLMPSGKPTPLRSLPPDFRKGFLQNPDGLALVLTLMVLALICAMVVEFSYGIYVQTAALHNWQISQRLSLLARSGVKLASKTATERAAKYPYTYPGLLEISPPKLFEDYSADLSLRLEDENSKFNVKSLVFPNGVVNVEFHVADLFKDVTGLPWARRPYDRVLLDPPRAGAREILPVVAASGARRVVYISCHSGSLARDAGLLVREHGFRLTAAGVMDMFPHTTHVEAMAVFDR